jgi:hypothetical protein
VLDGRTTADVDDNVLSAQCACAAIGRSTSMVFGPDEPPRTLDKLCPGLFVDIHMYIDQACNHLALAIAYGPTY